MSKQPSNLLYFISFWKQQVLEQGISALHQLDHKTALPLADICKNFKFGEEKKGYVLHSFVTLLINGVEYTISVVSGKSSEVRIIYNSSCVIISANDKESSDFVYTYLVGLYARSQM